MTILIAADEGWPEVVATKDVSACAVSDLALSGSGSSMSAVKRNRCGNKYRAMASSASFLGLTMRSERRQLATTLARPKSCKQSSIASRARMIRGSLGMSEREAVVRRMVHARSVFFAQGREVSTSRRWAWASTERKRWRLPRARSRVLDDGEFALDGIRLCRKRLKTGKA